MVAQAALSYRIPFPTPAHFHPHMCQQEEALREDKKHREALREEERKQEEEMERVQRQQEVRQELLSCFLPKQ